jgi:hypothetical protein
MMQHETGVTDGLQPLLWIQVHSYVAYTAYEPAYTPRPTWRRLVLKKRPLPYRNQITFGIQTDRILVRKGAQTQKPQSRNRKIQ